MGVTASQAIAKAKYYIGYEEKATADPRYLDDFHANAGRNNFQKFQPEAGAGNGDQWCQFFIDGIFVELTGSIKEARKMLYMGAINAAMTGYTPDGKQYFVEAKQWYTKPQLGDIIYFYSSSKKRVGHVGIVVSIDGNIVTTVEGNTSSTEYAENGGCVASHQYDISKMGGTNRVNGFGRPNYDKEDGEWIVTDKRQFIQDMYVSELYREPTQNEITEWVKRIDNGMDYNTVLNTFRNSDEGKKAWINMLYWDKLNRAPDEKGMQKWFDQMKAGKTRPQVLDGFINSDEYKNAHKK